MIACFGGVSYWDTEGYAAAVTFRNWFDADAFDESIVEVNDVLPYKSGQFFRRELPCLIAVLRTRPPINLAIIDGYAWPDGVSTPGLGAHPS